MESGNQGSLLPETILDGSRFVRACLRKPVDRTPVWFLRQAGRYMQEYRDVRKHHTLVEICKKPELAAEVTITAAEKLGVDAAIIFADLLLPLEPMGLDFEFQAGEGPVVHHPGANGGRRACGCGRIVRANWATWRGPLKRWRRTFAIGWASLAFAARRTRWPAT